MELNAHSDGNNVVLELPKSVLNLADTLDCGQCFRFEKVGDDAFSGIVGSTPLTVTQNEEKITFHSTSMEEFDTIWANYFDLNTDYEAIKQSLRFDKAISDAMDYCGGIRILRQPNFEALCSFIISQNNNIPRIKGCINKLCQKFGEPLADGKYGFPTAKVLAGCSIDDFQGLSLGYRDSYLVDCTAKIMSGEINLADISAMEIKDARLALRSIKGIGPKVAECALLFGFYRLEAFPIDTWIKKVLACFYPNGFPKEAADYAGIAQQYLFHYMRTCENAPKM